MLLGDDQERRIREVVSARIRPFLPGVSFRSIETSAGEGYLIVVVPHSADAPHAVVQDNALAYPVRDGTKTRWLSEYEVAGRYRDRYQARSAVSDMLGAVHAEGISRITLEQYPWLAVSLAPLIKGHREIGSAGLVVAERGFMSQWKASAPPGAPFADIRVFPGIRRAVVSEAWQYMGGSTNPHAELHYDGSGFAATRRLAETAEADPKIYGDNVLDGADKIYQDAMEIQILALVLFLARHAVDTGAAGECLLRAQLLLRPQPLSDDDSPRHGPIRVIPAQMCEPASFDFGPNRQIYEVVEWSLTLIEQTRTADTSVFLDELVSDLRAVVRTSYGLAADILGEFGVSEPIILRSDGQLNVDKLFWSRRQQIEQWAQRESLVAPAV